MFPENAQWNLYREKKNARLKYLLPFISMTILPVQNDSNIENAS